MEEEKNNLKIKNLIIADTNYAIEPRLVVYKTFSLISWILLVYTSWNTFVNQKYTYYLLHILNNERYEHALIEEEKFIFPVFIGLNLFHTFIMVLIIFGFINYIIYTILKPNNKIDEGMFGRVSKLHFIPLLLVSGIFLLMENVHLIGREAKYSDGKISYEYNTNQIDMAVIIIILLFLFSLVGFIFLLVIYIKTDLRGNPILVLSIKKGVYSSLMVLLFHNIFNCIIAFKFVISLENIHNNEYDLNDFFVLSKVILTPLLGMSIFIFSLVCIDAIALFDNLLMYIGMLIYYIVNCKSSKAITNDVVAIEIMISSFIIVLSFSGLFFFYCQRCDKKYFY